ncbi:MAG: thioredoxin-disulfide reductase [Nitrosarchaeum sp.]|nr:thioredoxin-disulfide reductase [Nitrosarchaeum sp.]MCA9819547.1 thioredoxin-disulfide reductase [Nitrosarchaeum sp.]
MMASDASGVILENKDEPPKIPDKKKTKFDVVIIGAGPAGYTAGIYCSRGGYDTLILSGILPGGQLVNTTEVENFPGFEKGIMGPDLMIEMRKQSQRMGTTIIDDEVVNVDFRRRPFKILTASEEYEGKAVIIATGANPRKLGLEGEQKFGGKGVSYCATCDGPFFRNQELVVVGGGDSAIEEATFLTKFATKVHLVHRRNELRASKVMQERAMNNEKIKFHWDSEVKDIKGDQKMQQAVLKNIKTGNEETLSVGGLFVAIGHEPNTKLFANQIELDDEGYVILKNKTHTNIEGIFAAGDVHDRNYRQAITAAGFGCMAAIDVDKYLTEHK